MARTFVPTCLMLAACLSACASDDESPRTFSDASIARDGGGTGVDAGPPIDAGPPTETTIGQCSDRVGNDGDGFADCADPDCRGLMFCRPRDAGGMDDGSVAVDAGGEDAGVPDAGIEGCVLELRGGAPALDSCEGDAYCDCGGDEDCPSGGGTCVPAFGRRYVLAPFRVDFNAMKPDGSCWDGPGCGTPDPYVAIGIDGEALGSTPIQDDVFTGDWSGEPPMFGAPVLRGSAVTLVAADSDVFVDDIAHECEVAVTADVLRARIVECAGGGVSSIRAFIVAE